MDIEEIRRINRDAVDSGSVLMVIPESEDQQDYSTGVEDVVKRYTNVPLAVSIAVLAIIAYAAYTIGESIKPSFVMTVDSNGEQVVDRNRLLLLSASLSILTVAIINYLM